MQSPTTSLNHMLDLESPNMLNRIDMEEEKIIVEVRGGVAYCDDSRVIIIDYDNLEDE